jgi:hypothetical protein
MTINKSQKQTFEKIAICESFSESEIQVQRTRNSLFVTRPPRFIRDSSLIRPAAFVVISIIFVLLGAPQYGAYVLYWLPALQEIIVL